jgi:glycosyltransferase involved in cell wall biosynthesis
MRFTVLTATYNRARTLPALFRSLCAQTFRDFEWVIVDDGSADGTRELVAAWDSFFPIRYTWKPNGGKHTAVNFGVQQAAGEFVFIVDSDDRCLPHTLERFDHHWRQLPDPDRFACLSALCYEEDGATVVGSRLGSDYVDTFRLRDALAVLDGDGCGIIRTDVFRNFLYPVFEGERFMIEGVVWNRVLSRYAARYVNEPLKIAGYAPGGLGRSGDLRFSSPKGAVLYHLELALSNVPLSVRAKSALNALRFSFVAAARGLRPPAR